MTDTTALARQNGQSDLIEDDLSRSYPMPLFLSGRRGDGKVAYVSLCDYGWARRFAWFVTPAGYAFCNTGIPSGPANAWGQPMQQRQPMLLHRLVTNAAPGQRVDHADGDKFNCVIGNLRFATWAENNRNVGPRSHSRQPYKGVRRADSRWAARIRVNGQEVYLGRFDNAESAALAYDAAARRLHGAFARTNFPEARS